MRLHTFIALGCVLLFGHTSGQAQFDASRSLDRLRQLESLLPDDRQALDAATEERREDAVPADETFGEQVLLRRIADRSAFRIFADASVVYTDNAFLTDNFKESDHFGVFQVGAGYQRRLTDRWFADVEVRQQVIRYSDFDELDFDVGILSLGTSYRLPSEWGGLTVLGRYSLQRLTAARDSGSLSRYDEFLRVHTFTGGVQKLFAVNNYSYFQTGLLGRLGYTQKFSGMDAFDPERNDIQAFFGYTHLYSRSLQWNANYSIARVFYKNVRVDDGSKRRDWNHQFSVSGQYNVRDWMAIVLSGNYTINDSNGSLFDYKATNLGATLELSARF